MAEQKTESNSNGSLVYARNDAVILFGESAVKATSEIMFPTAVIIVNAAGRASARGPIFRVFEAGFAAGSRIRNTRVVSSVRGFTVSDEDVRNGKVTKLRCQGIRPADLVSKLVSEIARRRG